MAGRRAAGPFDLSTTAGHFTFVGLYPVFVRGQAFLAAHQGSEAVSDFQKILDHHEVVADLPIGALVRVGLARAYVVQNDSAKARTAYQDFLLGALERRQPRRAHPEASQSRVREATCVPCGFYHVP